MADDVENLCGKVENVKDDNEGDADVVHNSNTAEDAELEDILEDALQDLERQNIPCHSNTGLSESADTNRCQSHTDNVSRDISAGSTEAGASSQSPVDPLADMKGMESLIMSLMSGDSSSLSHQLSDLGLDSDSLGADDGAGFAETLQRTLGDLTQSTQDLQHDDLSEEELMRLVSSLGADGIDGIAENSGADEEILPMMHGMMKSLLSKDILYPSLKDISAQYPTWLENHRDEISHDDYERYEKQQRLMASIVCEFEAEQPTDDDDVKRHRFERVLDIMQQMQALGHPPKELVGDTPRGLELDEHGMPKLPGGLPSPEQCSIM